jgi:hypothetical protein
VFFVVVVESLELELFLGWKYVIAVSLVGMSRNDVSAGACGRTEFVFDGAADR